MKNEKKNLFLLGLLIRKTESDANSININIIV